jgi:hypothetical protein
MMRSGSHRKTLQNPASLPAPLHYTDLLPSPHLPPLASPCEKNTGKRKKKRFLYLGLKISRGEVGGEGRRICRSKQDNKTTNK